MLWHGGDEAAFGELWTRSFASLRDQANALLHDLHAAEDVAQDALLAAYEHPERYEPGVHRGGFRAWVGGIAHNMAVDRLRERGRAEPREPEQIVTIADEQAWEDEELVFPSLRQGELASFMRRLPERQRRTLVMRFAHDLSPQQIAQKLNTTVEAVYDLQKRAFATLKQQLEAADHPAARRAAARRESSPMLIRLKPLPVLGARRFAISRGAHRAW